MKCLAVWIIAIALCTLTGSCNVERGEIRGDIHNFGPNEMGESYLLGTFEDGFCIILVHIRVAEGWRPVHYNTKVNDGVVRRIIEWESGEQTSNVQISIRSRQECDVAGKRYDLTTGRLLLVELDRRGSVSKIVQKLSDTQDVSDAGSAEQLVASILYPEGLK